MSLSHPNEQSPTDDRREELATARRSSPLAEGDPRYHVHQWDRGRQPRRSTRCRLTPPVTNFRQYLDRTHAHADIRSTLSAHGCGSPCSFHVCAVLSKVGCY